MVSTEMKKLTIQSLAPVFILVIGFFPMMRMDCVFARSKPAQVEHSIIKDDIVKLLTDEYEMVDSLTRKLTSFQDVISELRSMEVYPAELVNMAESVLVKYDKGIGLLEQTYKETNEKVALQKASLVDAMEIMREMFKSGPVQSMFTVLENGNSKRINELKKIEKQVDRLWNTGDSLIEFVMSLTINTAQERDGMDRIFSANSDSIIKTCINDYCKKIDIIKNAIREKASAHQVNDLYKIEKYDLQKLMNMKKYDFARWKINSMKKRYAERRDELNLLLAKVEFSSRNFSQALSIISTISETERNHDQLLILKIQSLYSLKEYEIIWKEYRGYDVSRLEGKARNLMIWILIECGFALQIENDYAQLASMIDNRQSYTHHVLHALARTYLRAGDEKTALSIMESALKYKVMGENDRLAVKEIRLALAQVYYEMKEYEKSLALFYDILNKHEDFERALFGIVWCYLKLNNDRKSEIALKKLINLKPESPLATEAIYILARKNLIRANTEWKKMVYLDKEEKRLTAKLDFIIEKKRNNTRKEDIPKYNYAYEELKILLARLKNEKRMNYDSLKAMYDRTERICDMIYTHYQTGMFQENIFSAEMENNLFLLDSALNKIKENRSGEDVYGVFSNAIQDRHKIKNVAKKAKVFAVITAIDEFRWEREYLDWKKAGFREKELETDSCIKVTSDTTKLEELRKKKSKITKAIDSLILCEEKMVSANTGVLKSRIDSLFRMDIDNEDAAYMNYQYGELKYNEENMRYSALYEQYEMEMNIYFKKLNDFRNGLKLEHPVKPEMPVLDHSGSIIKFRKVIDEYPESQYRAPAIYSLAWCYNDMSEFDSAMYCMEELTRNFPACPYTPQAWMYSGEYNFDKGKLDSAIVCYQAVLKYPESEWFEEALYKLAWSQYRLSNPEKAISSFLALVDLGDGTLSGATLLEKESMDYIAISFSEADVTGEKGLERALIFAEKLNDVDRGCRILHRLATVFREQGRYEIAKKTFQNMLKLYPGYSGNPIVESELVKLLEREPSLSDISRMKREIFEKYNRNSNWAKMQSEDMRKMADSIAQKQLYDAAIGYHQLALQKNDSSAYQSALSAYRELITIYPTSSVANECHYNLAEIQFAIGNYLEAAEEYMAVTRRYPDSKYRETAAWNAIVASQNLLKMEKSLNSRQ